MRIVLMLTALKNAAKHPLTRNLLSRAQWWLYIIYYAPIHRPDSPMVYFTFSVALEDISSVTE